VQALRPGGSRAARRGRGHHGRCGAGHRGQDLCPADRFLDPDTQQVRAVLDWEMSTPGDPLMDLALLLIYWEQTGDGLRHQVNVARNLTTADGFWSREQLVDAYAQATTGPLDHLQACLGPACLKLAVVMESIHYRHLSGQALDPPFWPGPGSALGWAEGRHSRPARDGPGRCELGGHWRGRPRCVKERVSPAANIRIVKTPPRTVSPRSGRGPYNSPDRQFLEELSESVLSALNQADHTGFVSIDLPAP